MIELHSFCISHYTALVALFMINNNIYIFMKYDSLEAIDKEIEEERRHRLELRTKLNQLNNRENEDASIEREFEREVVGAHNTIG